MTIQSIMNQDASGKELVNFAQITARNLVKNRLKSSQLRLIFSEVRKIQALWMVEQNKTSALRRLSMLKPKLYYQAKRHSSMDLLRDVLCAAIDEVLKVTTEEQDERFQKFVDLNEAIIAFHKAEGGLN